MQAARLRKMVEDAAERGAAKALCNQCIFTADGINILKTVIQIGLKFKGFIILGLALALVAMCLSGFGIAYIIVMGGLG